MKIEAIENSTELTLTKDSWLSEIFSYPVLRLDFVKMSETLLNLGLREKCFVYTKIGVKQIDHVAQLTGIGFRVVDTSLTFNGLITGSTRDGGIRFAVPEDHKAISRISKSTFRYSRFHLDPLVPNGVADKIKAAWASNYFEGKRGDGMVVAVREGFVVGFLQIFWAANDALVIDLIGVDKDCQGQGIGRDLILFAANFGTGDGRVPTLITVGTQAANIPSVRLYESLGFRLASAQYVLHYHGESKGEK